MPWESFASHQVHKYFILPVSFFSKLKKKIIYEKHLCCSPTEGMKHTLVFFLSWIHTICFCSRQIYLLCACAHTRQTDGKVQKRLDVYHFSITPLNFTGLQQISKEYMVFSELAHTYTVWHKSRNTRNQEYNHTHIAAVPLEMRLAFALYKFSYCSLLKYQWLVTWSRVRGTLLSGQSNFVLQELWMWFCSISVPLVLWQRN